MFQKIIWCQLIFLYTFSGPDMESSSHRYCPMVLPNKKMTSRNLQFTQMTDQGKLNLSIFLEVIMFWKIP